MRNRITVITLASLLLVSLQAALSRNGFDDQIARIRQLVAGNDLHVATGTTMSLRRQVVSREELRVDFAASRDLLQRDGASIAVMLTNLQSAQDRFRAGDSRGAAQALDVVAVLLITLEHSADPVTRYSEATRAMAAETAQKGDAG
ncbi:MAG: hypothetical protein M3Y27_27350, partial [Acidobacteriota bacterium]|nr:hypothetical protein [Acidobacteriota bacterium]